jgi:hypothetical protein
MVTDRADVESLVWEFRYSKAINDTARCDRLRQQWKDRTGEDSAIETAFGGPVERQALEGRRLRLLEQFEDVNSQLSWLMTIKVV